VIVVVADRVTTSLAVHHLHETRHVWGPFGLSLTFNSGFAFSLFSGRAVLVTVLLCAGVVVLAFAVGRVRTVPLAVGAGLVLGGAIGNLSERIVGTHGGQVPDFITLDYWPTFNLADACVTIGIVVVIVSLLLGHHDVPPDARGRTSSAPMDVEGAPHRPEREEAP
jgi:signal peptidase II